MSYRQQARAKDAGSAYMPGQRRLIRWLLASGKTGLLVACLPDATDTVVGWSVTGDRVVHYVFVKQDFRRLGIGRALVAPYVSRVGVVYSHKTHHPIPIPDGWRYDPYAVMFGVE